MSESIGDPFEIHRNERALYEPLKFDRMLELGSKQFRGRSYKDYFTALGFRHMSVDLNGKRGSLVRDLRKPLNLGTFDMVTNIGTTEHVTEQYGVWANICEALEVGSVFISTTPAPGHFEGHGLYYPHDEFYESLAELNGLAVERLFRHKSVGRRAGDELVFARLVRERPMRFKMPADELIWRTPWQT